MKTLYFISFLLFGSLCFSQAKTENLLIYFDSNSSVLNNDSQEQIRFKLTTESTIIDSVRITGYCDEIGSVDKNLKLSLSRANSVANFVKNLNKNIRIYSYGKGEIAPDNNHINIEEIRKRNRRVEVLISYHNIKNKTTVLGQKIVPKPLIYKSFDDTLSVGDKVILKDLHFKGSLTHYEDEDEAAIQLNKIVTYLNKNPNCSIEIHGHVCCISKSFNDAYDRETKKTNLSQNRAKKIYDYLISKGISSTRMTHKGYGRKYPILGGEESDNKRVEIVISKI